MLAAGREYDDAVKAFDAAIQKPDSKAEISEAFHALLAKHKAYQAFGKNFLAITRSRKSRYK